jgi:hypothetical protein
VKYGWSAGLRERVIKTCLTTVYKFDFREFPESSTWDESTERI